MKIFITFTIVAICLALPVVANYALHLTGRGRKTVLGLNLFSFFGLLTAMITMALTGNISVFAEPEAAVAVDAAANGMKYLSAALAVGLSGIGAGVAIASSASSAMGAISEDSSLFGKALILVVLAEGVALYGMLIALLLLNS